MAVTSFNVVTEINNSPEAVIAFVADVRNRPKYFKAVSISEINGEPGAVGSTWKWTFGVLGLEFHGTGHCTQHEPGKLYGFQTLGGMQSTFTYRAVPEGQGTRLTVNVEYDLPENILAKLGELVRKAEAERVLKNLKKILDK